MKSKAIFVVLALFVLVCAIPAGATTTAKAQAPQITGQYIEARTADVYTGPCIANSEIGLAGKQAVMGWHVDHGTWGNVDLDGLSVVAVVNADVTLGAPDGGPVHAAAVLIVDEAASDAQRAALVNFAQAQTGTLLNKIVSIVSAPMSFETNIDGRHMSESLVAGNLVRITTRALNEGDEFCHNEEVFYPPLAGNLVHAMPAVATEAGYRGNDLGVTWKENERRGVFVGSFSN
ncbi:MAG TPA: DUF1326 domain-containing protein [Candidatus Acidoferrum sp.]|nr:DUF1326 domain-containing protein [Candidatus Acidoferrum sp.]